LLDRKEEGIPSSPGEGVVRLQGQDGQKDDPEGFCLPGGGPSATSNRTQAPWEFIQQPEQKRIVRIFEQGHMWQVIYMDGREHPKEAFDLPTWLGHSTGRWMAIAGRRHGRLQRGALALGHGAPRERRSCT
jgi:hypothetical protein